MTVTMNNSKINIHSPSNYLLANYVVGVIFWCWVTLVFYVSLLWSTFVFYLRFIIVTLFCDPLLWVKILGWDIYICCCWSIQFCHPFFFSYPFCYTLLWSFIVKHVCRSAFKHLDMLHHWWTHQLMTDVSFLLSHMIHFVIQTERHERWEMILKCHLIWSCSPF